MPEEVPLMAFCGVGGRRDGGEASSSCRGAKRCKSGGEGACYGIILPWEPGEDLVL